MNYLTPHPSLGKPRATFPHWGRLKITLCLVTKTAIDLYNSVEITTFKPWQNAFNSLPQWGKVARGLPSDG